jgi:hypothetical protein
MNNRLSRRRFLASAGMLAGSAAVGIDKVLAFGSHGGSSNSNLIVTPFNYDPDNVGMTSFSFINRYGYLMLHLVKTGLTDPPNAPDGNASGATVTTPAGVNSDTVGSINVNQLGFIISTDSQNGGGAPRFNVYDNKGNYWFFAFDYCEQYGTKTDIANTELKQISVNPANIPYALSASTGTTPVFTNSTIVTEIDIIFDVGTDEGLGFADICHIQVNNQFCNFNLNSIGRMKHRLR